MNAKHRSSIDFGMTTVHWHKQDDGRYYSPELDEWRTAEEMEKRKLDAKHTWDRITVENPEASRGLRPN